jgi:predicted glycosyltransferase
MIGSENSDVEARVAWALMKSSVIFADAETTLHALHQSMMLKQEKNTPRTLNSFMMSIPMAMIKQTRLFSRLFAIQIS